MRTRRIASLVAIAPLSLLVFSACSGNDTSNVDMAMAAPDLVGSGAPDMTAPADLSPPPDLAPAGPGAGATAQLAVLEMTDVHTNVLSYDYYKLAEDDSIGLERLATLIKNARAQFTNTLLVDNGDTIQGTVLSDYQATVSPITCDQTLAVYKVMNALGFDVGGIGNHEFNFGLAYLNQVTGHTFDVDPLPPPSMQKACAGPTFPQVLANVRSARSMKPLFDPYVILDKSIKAKSAAGADITSSVKIGVIAFTPPTITSWDKRWLDGKVYTTGVLETALQYVPEMRAKGAEIIVVICHGGLDNSPYDPSLENGSYYLALVPNVDALLIGHSHQVFPLASSSQAQFNLPKVDKAKGFVNNVPTVMAYYWGKDLGVINFSLKNDGTRWSVDTTKTTVEERPIQNADKTYVAADPTIAPMVATEHQATIAYVKTPIGMTDFRMTTYFADVGEPGAIQIVNQAQQDYVAAYVAANLPQYAKIPVISVSAPFKSGFGGGSDFTDVAMGNMAINNAADLYLYPNTVYAVKIKGSDLKNWLETAAQRFNQIDPAKVTAQALVSSFPGYNFDMPTTTDLTYQIDVTQPLMSRIKNLTYKGSPVMPTDDFIVATNNYRASGGGNFPGIDGSKTIFASPDANRDVLIAYIKKTMNLTRANNGSARSWSFVKVQTAGAVTFTSAQNVLPVAQAAGINNVSVLMDDDGSGKKLSLYGIDLSK